VKEQGDQGVVAELVVENRGDLPVLILDGEVLVGGKQNRVLNTSVLIGAKQTTPVPVSCVEQGRWSRGGRHRSSPHHSTSRIRSSLRRSSLRSLRETGDHRTDQGEVWEEVSYALASSGSVSSSMDLSQAYLDHAKNLEEFAKSIELPEDCVGILVAVDREIVSGDVFDRSDSLRRYAPRLLRSAAMDRLTRGSVPEREPEEAEFPGLEEALRFLDRAGSAREEAFASPGIGSAIRSEAGELLTSALAVEEAAVHVGLCAVAE
jgi:hypothetical protein